MMGWNHAMSGVLAGVGVAAALPAAPVPIRVLAVAVTGGAAMLPDLDHPSATAARSLGLVTKLLARGISALSIAIYYGTYEGRDHRERRSGHRLVTHTVPGCLAFACLVLAASLVSPIAAGVAVALIVGLLGLGLAAFGAGYACLAGVATVWSLNTYPGWWWVLPVATFVGCLVHCLGDALTNSGVPLCWPLRFAGGRWQPVRPPVTFSAGDAIETHIVTPLLSLATVTAAFFALGGLRLLAVVAGGA